MRKYKSIQFNMFLNLLKTVFATIFPLITFKYISDVLGTSGVGKINFSNSIVQYFTVIAGLGISAYATRELAKVRENKTKVNEIASELFSINIISMAVSYVGLIIIAFLGPGLQDYRILIFIQSLVIFFSTVGVDWVNIVYEDYIYITIRTIAVQLLALLLILFFVKTSKDYTIYAIVNVAASGITCLSNYFYVKKYIYIKFVFNKKIFKHLKPILMIFFMNIAISIFVTSDTTMIGFLRGDEEVGIYSVATKIYSTLKTVIVALTSVTIPRLSYNYEHNREEYVNNLNSIFTILLFFCLPVIFAVEIVPDLFIMLISNGDYLDSRFSLRILGIAILPTTLSTLINSNILLAERKEKYMLISTSVAAFVNIMLNFFLIPILGIAAAAITTLISEIIVIIIASIQAQDTLKQLKMKIIFTNLNKSLIGCIYIFLLYVILSKVVLLGNFFYFLYVVLSITGYFVIEIILKNSVFDVIKK